MPRPVAGYQNLPVSTTAVTLSVPAGADYAVVRCETNSIRWTDDGTTPTAGATGNGVPMLAADPPLTIPNPATFKAIRVTADGALHVLYYRP
jgi:hypothetical protein